MQWTMPGARRRGRPHTAWMDNIQTWTGLTMEESIRMAEDRNNGESTFMVWSKTAEEQNKTDFTPQLHSIVALSRHSFPIQLRVGSWVAHAKWQPAMHNELQIWKWPSKYLQMWWHKAVQGFKVERKTHRREITIYTPAGKHHLCIADLWNACCPHWTPCFRQQRGLTVADLQHTHSQCHYFQPISSAGLTMAQVAHLRQGLWARGASQLTPLAQLNAERDAFELFAIDTDSTVL